jgi:hypothetical protein
MVYSDSLTHARRVDFSAQVFPGSSQQVLYQPGDIDGFSLIEGYRYSGQVLQLRCFSNRFLRLEFWLQSSLGERITLAQNVQVNDSQAVLVDLLKSGLYLGGGASLGVSLPDGNLPEGAKLTIYGFAEERGNTRPSGTVNTSLSWGQIGGDLENQADLVEVLDAQAQTTALRFAELESEIDGLDSGTGISVAPPSNPTEGQLWREADATTQAPKYPWSWRWMATPGQWVSQESWIQSVLTDNSSGAKSGSFSARYPAGFSQLWVGSVEIQGFLDNPGQAGTWRFELSNRNSNTTGTTWLTVLSQGQPYNQLWKSSLPVNAPLSTAQLGYGWKITPLTNGGAVQFHASFPVHVVRPNP